MAALDFCAMPSSAWHLDTSSDWLSSARDFLGAEEEDPPEADDIVPDFVGVYFMMGKWSSVHSPNLFGLSESESESLIN